MNPTQVELEKAVSRLFRWYRLGQALTWGLRGILFGLGAAFGLSLILVFNSRWLENEFLRWVIALPGISLILFSTGAFFWPRSISKSAQLFDRVLGLKERVSTALELSREPDTLHTSEELKTAQLRDTLSHSSLADPRKLLPRRIPRRELLLLLVLVAATLLVWAQGEAFFQAAHQKRALQQAVEKEIQQVEAIKSELETDPRLTAEQTETLTRPLDEALQNLEQSESLEQAVASLTGAADQLQALSDPLAAQQGETLREAGEQIRQNPVGPLDSFGQNLAEGDFSSAASDLASLDVSNLSRSEAEALARQLEQAASAVEDSLPGLAGEIQQAADAVRNGDEQAARQALQQAAQTLAQTGQTLAQSQAAQKAASQLGQSQARLIQSGQGANQSASVGQPGQSETGQSPEGQPGSNPQPGSGLPGGGSGRGEGEGITGQSGEAGSQPIEQSNGPGDAGERAYERIYAPELLGGEGGEQVLLPDSGQPGETVLGQVPAQPGAPGPGSVPYVEVFPVYQQAAHQAIESGFIPIQMRSLVRDYFSSLEP